MKKIIISFVCVIFLLIGFTLNSMAAEPEFSWYIKRNGNSQPKIQDEQKIIYEYDGYFIDKNLSDDSAEKKIYLTFDLGYSNENVERIVQVLREENVPAAFFILDNILLKNCDLVTEMLSDGHLLCNHTKNHKNLSSASEEEIKSNILGLEALYEEKIGCQMSKYFRFPEGRYSEHALKCVQSLGYKTVFWSFAYADWDNGAQLNTDSAIKKVLDNTHNGGIFLFHPTSKTNAEIFPTLISKWRELGYSFGTLDEL